jgi:hypothetical protein
MKGKRSNFTATFFLSVFPSLISSVIVKIKVTVKKFNFYSTFSFLGEKTKCSFKVMLIELTEIITI